MFLVKTSFVMKTLYLHLTSHFDLIPFNGSANASELTVFFFVKDVISKFEGRASTYSVF